jgi:hypothetical protein
MAFDDKTLLEAWERSAGQCECEKRNHRHFYTPCARSLSWKARGKAGQGGWEARPITSSGGDGVHNCEILCWECYRSASAYVPRLFSGPGVTSIQTPPEAIELDFGDAELLAQIRQTSNQAPISSAEGVSSEAAQQEADLQRLKGRAKEPFRFCDLALLRKMTGRRACNLVQMVDNLEKVPDGVIYYHTHQFLQEHHYLTPEPPNDFAVWVADSLGDEVLAERLASVNPFSFPDLGEVRKKLINITQEHLGQYPNHREAMEGKEFYFVESKRFIFPTPYVAQDINEFLDGLRKVGLGSLYFHIFESRIRSEKGLNDFSLWLMEALGEEELGRLFARLDPYTYTLEGLRSSLIRLIENRASLA